MAWANHARCLQCGARLPLYRKLTDGEFCSATHRKAFQDDQCKLAVARLMETQQACRRVTDAARQQADLEVAMDPPPPAGSLPMTLQPQYMDGRIAVDPLSYDAAGDPALPRRTDRTARKRALGMAEGTRLPVPAAQPMPAAVAQPHQPVTLVAPMPALPRDSSRPLGFVGSLPHAGDMRRLPQIDPAGNRRGAAQTAAAIIAGSRAWLPLPSSLSPRAGATMGLARAGRLYSLTLETAKPGARTAAQPAPAACWHGRTTLPQAVKARATSGLALRATQLAANSIALLTPAAVASAKTPPIGQAAALSVSPAAAERPRMPAVAAGECMLSIGKPVAMAGAEVIRASADAALSAAGSSAEYRQPAPRKPQMRGGQIAVGPRLGKALDLPPLKAIQPAPAGLMKIAGGNAEEHLTGLVDKPEYRFAAATVSLPMAKMQALPVGGQAANIQIELRGSLPAARAFVSSVAFPRTRFTPQPMAPEGSETPSWTPPPVSTVAGPGRNWGAFLRDTPLSVRLMAAMIPVLLFIALRPAPAPAQAAERSGVTQFVNAHLTAVRSAIQNRAGIELLDDFRSGLDNWESRREAVQWSYDQTGFVKPGPLAVYKPSVGLADYDVEFLGQIDHKALAWVFRAADLDNYQVAKLVLLQAGPMPTIGLVRYTVIHGKEGPHTTATLPLNVHGDSLYRVRLEVRGADFTLYVQNQLVQFWSDARLKAGGVGFFSAKGEQSRLRWVQVSHQYDAIGRLCAYFRPFAMAAYNLQPTNGSWK